ncbi:hypothetical protein D3C85_1655520 [compost metagenome]
MPFIINGTSACIESKLASSKLGSSASRTLIRTFSQRSPSMMSSPLRPSMMSLASPPRMMLPDPNSSSALPAIPSAPGMAAVPIKARRPLIRSICDSTLPCAPLPGRVSASS